MKLKISLILLAVALTSIGGTSVSKVKSFSQPCSFFPPNKLKFPVRNSGQMPEGTFRRVVQVVNDIYAPLFRQVGRPPLYISPRWTDDDVNAFATICNEPKLIGTPDYPPECGKMRTSLNVFRPFSLVVMFGGLARHPFMTPEGFILVACHEIGHHLGGYPRYEHNSNWASTEGQSDYFATAKCARKVFGAIGNNAAWVQRAAVPMNVRTTCNANFSTSVEEAAICMRSAMGGLSLARVLGSTGQPDQAQVGFTTPDRRVTPELVEGHPPAQCRLDTYFAGSVCRISADTAFGPNDSRTGACHPSRLEHIGVRPTCWFRDRI